MSRRGGIVAAVCVAALGGWFLLGRGEAVSTGVSELVTASQPTAASSNPASEPTAASSSVGQPPDAASAGAASASAASGPTAETAESSAAGAAGAALTPNAVVLDVFDGDTIEVSIGSRRATVRLIGIDTPEATGGFLPPECGGDAATRRTAELLPPGTELFLQRDVELYDRYDRVLSYVYRAADGLFVNRYLLLDGYAGTMHFAPNTEHKAVLDAAQAEARAARRGIWSECGGPNKPLRDSY